MKENHARTYRFRIVLLTSSKKFVQFVRKISDSLPIQANCVVSAEFHCAILTEETRIASKIFFIN